MFKAYCPMKISMTVICMILDKANHGGLIEQERDGRGEKEYDFCVHNTINRDVYVYIE